jgi:hypothetical protein
VYSGRASANFASESRKLICDDANAGFDCAYTAAVRYRVESGEKTGKPFVHVQDTPLEAGDTFFHPPGEAGHGFYKVTSVDQQADDFDAVIKADRLEVPGL